MLPVPVQTKELDRIFSQPLPKYFTAEDVSRILSAHLHDLRAHTFINTLWKTGARCSEALAVCGRDFDPVGKSLRIATLKRGLKREAYAGTGRPKKPGKTERRAERIVPLPDDLVVSLTAWSHVSGRGLDGPLFGFSRPTAYRIVRDACRRAGFTDERTHPHAFRHSYAVHLLREGVPVTILKDLLGHSNISSTLVYLRITQPEVRALMSRVRW